MPESLSIPTVELPADHEALIAAAEAATREAYDPDRFDGAHLVGAAVRGTDGAVYTGVSLPAKIGRASVCAEPIAVGTAIDAGTTAFEACVAVGHPRPGKNDDYEVIPPCGVCRELLADYGVEAVIVPGADDLIAVPAMALLPTRTW